MQAVQQGDRVHVTYVKRFQDGSVVSSRKRTPLEVTVGIDHPRLPGLGLALVGLTPGTSTTIKVPTERAYGQPISSRVRRLARSRFPEDKTLTVGKWVRLTNRHGHPRLVRVLELREKSIVVDTNHRWAGQMMELKVELVDVQTAKPRREPGSSPG